MDELLAHRPKGLSERAFVTLKRLYDAKACDPCNPCSPYDETFNRNLHEMTSYMWNNFITEGYGIGSHFAELLRLLAREEHMGQVDTKYTTQDVVDVLAALKSYDPGALVPLFKGPYTDDDDDGTDEDRDGLGRSVLVRLWFRLTSQRVLYIHTPFKSFTTWLEKARASKADSIRSARTLRDAPLFPFEILW